MDGFENHQCLVKVLDCESIFFICVIGFTQIDKSLSKAFWILLSVRFPNSFSFQKTTTSFFILPTSKLYYTDIVNYRRNFRTMVAKCILADMKYLNMMSELCQGKCTALAAAYGG